MNSVLPVHIKPELNVHASKCEHERMVQTEDLRAAFVVRLKKALAKQGIPEWGAGARLAEITGKTAKAASKWLNAETMPGRENMKAIAIALSVRVEWLQYGEGWMVDPDLVVGGQFLEIKGYSPAPPKNRLTDRPGFIEIPQLDVRGSMGSGAIRPEVVDVIQRMTVSMDFLRQSVTFSKPDNLALITGYGDSMEGTFNDGDLLLVDRGVNDVKIDAVYVLSLNDELYIKRLQRRGDGTFSMISDNRKYEPIPISEKDLARFQVLGRVLLAWNARKL